MNVNDSITQLVDKCSEETPRAKPVDMPVTMAGPGESGCQYGANQNRSSMGSKVNSLVLISILFSVSVSSVFSQFAVEDDGCRTPEGTRGDCIAIKQCPQLLALIQQKPLPQAAIDRIRKYQCGFEGSAVKVCCPASSGGGTTPPDVSKHRNINLITTATCGILNTDDKIINGNRTAVGEFPWMALISYSVRGRRDFQCGATLINKNYVLTAAHCLTNLGSKTIAGVRLGEHTTNENPDCEVTPENERICAPAPQDIGIGEIIVHPGYERAKLQNDIGLIRLAKPANLDGEYVGPICLPLGDSNRNVQFKVGENLTVAGWGITEARVKSEVLLKVHVPYIAADDCRRRYVGSATLVNSQLCAGGKNQHDSCSGDSGGPLKKLGSFDNDVRYIQHGIVSFGPRQCGIEGFPGVYTRVAFFMDWILDNMKP